MRDVAFYGWVNPASICLDHHILSPVFEVVICASRNRAGVAGQITRFSASVFAMFLMGQLEGYAADTTMLDACIDLFTLALHAFNARLELDVDNLAITLLRHLDAALPGGGTMEDRIILHPL